MGCAFTVAIFKGIPPSFLPWGNKTVGDENSTLAPHYTQPECIPNIATLNPVKSPPMRHLPPSWGKVGTGGNLQVTPLPEASPTRGEDLVCPAGLHANANRSNRGAS